jgi:hypothetical protein
VDVEVPAPKDLLALLGVLRKVAERG